MHDIERRHKMNERRIKLDHIQHQPAWNDEQASKDISANDRPSARLPGNNDELNSANIRCDGIFSILSGIIPPMKYGRWHMRI